MTLGHDGESFARSFRAKRPAATATVRWSAALLAVAALVRVLQAGAFPEHYGAWIMASQALWTVAFGLFVLSFGPIFIQRNAEG